MLTLCLAAWVIPVQASAQRVPSRDSALRLLDRGRYEQAIDAFQRIAEARPDDGLSWFDLSQAHHAAGAYEAALEFGRRAAEFPGYRPTCLYNLACSYALMGQADNAAAELEQAFAAGFLDYDLIATDTDLELLRSAGRLELPEQHEYETLRHNSVEIPYLMLLPEDYDAKRTDPAVVAFAPGGMARARRTGRSPRSGPGS
jgi:Flp pilus assembly protein TadD